MSVKKAALILGFICSLPTLAAAQEKCTLGTLRGQYVFTGRGFIEAADPGVQRHHYGVFIFDGAGKFYRQAVLQPRRQDRP